MVRSVKVHRAALWILGEYISSSKEILEVIEVVNQTIGEIPIVEAEQRKLAGEEEQTDSNKAVNSTAQTITTTTKVTSDGTCHSKCFQCCTVSLI